MTGDKVVVSSFICDKDSKLRLLLDISVNSGENSVVESTLGTVVDRLACNRDRISCAKSINLFRIVDTGIAVVVSAASIILFESASVVGASVELVPIV